MAPRSSSRDPASALSGEPSECDAGSDLERWAPGDEVAWAGEDGYAGGGAYDARDPIYDNGSGTGQHTLPFAPGARERAHTAARREESERAMQARLRARRLEAVERQRGVGKRAYR